MALDHAAFIVELFYLSVPYPLHIFELLSNSTDLSFETRPLSFDYPDGISVNPFRSESPTPKSSPARGPENWQSRGPVTARSAIRHQNEASSTLENMDRVAHAKHGAAEDKSRYKMEFATPIENAPAKKTWR